MPSREPPPHEPRRAAALVGALVLVVVLVAGIALIEFLMAEPYRQAAIRLVAALVLLLVVARIRARVRTSIELGAAGDSERPSQAGWAPPSFSHTAFEHFHDEIRFSARSQRYFEHVLWPRLSTLGRAGAAPATPLDKPPGRRFGRGPSLEALRGLIASLERRR